MRIDIAKNLKAIIQQEKRRSTRRWVIFFGLIAVICYSFVLLSTYVLKRNAGDVSSPTTVNKYEQSIIRVDAHVAAQTLHYRPTKAVLYRSSNYTPSGLIRHEVAANPVTNNVATHATVGAQAVKVHTTSSATVHNVGSGAGGGKAAAAISTQSSAVPVSSSTSNIVMPTAVWTSSRALSAQNTMQSEQQLIAANSADNATNHHGRIRRVDDDPLDPFMDPIGDGLPLLLLAAVIYAAIALIKRKHLITQTYD